MTPSKEVPSSALKMCKNDEYKAPKKNTELLGENNHNK